jgi:hypothetical protein
MGSSRVGKHPVRRWTSSEAAAQRCPRIDANIVEYAYIHQGSSTAIAISAVLGGRDAGVLQRGAPLACRRGCNGSQVGGLGTGDVVVVADRGRHRERRQASRDVSAADQRYPAVGGGQPELAAGAGAGQESEEELAVDRCPGDRDRAPALGERLPGIPVADRVAERRGGSASRPLSATLRATPLSRAARITLR